MTSIVSLKYIIIGASGVGKTALMKQLVEGSFSEEPQSTIGVEFDSTLITVDQHQVKLHIWDTAGQERFRSIAKAYFRNAVGVLLVFDITERKSFDDLSTWLNDVHALCDPNVVVQLIGNKADMASSRAVTVSEAEAFAKNHQMSYLETSAKNGDNVSEAFIRVASQILAHGAPKVTTNDTPAPQKEDNQEKKGCC